MKRVLACTVLVAWLFGCSTARNNLKPELSIQYINSNLTELQGTEVKLTGYVRLGFDGWHVVCSMSDQKNDIEIHNSLWLETPACYQLAKEKQLRKGIADVAGILVDLGGEHVRPGGIFVSQVDVISIDWVD